MALLHFTCGAVFACEI